MKHFSLLRVAFGILFLACTIPSATFADGMMMKPDPYGDRWDYANESNQQAFIQHEDGIEKMILSVGVTDSEAGVVWIFPVPAAPEDVSLDILKNIPQLRGEEISRKTESYLEDIQDYLHATQWYPIPYIVMSQFSTATALDDAALGSAYGGKGDNIEAEQDVTVFSHVNKEGMTSEIITAKTGAGLFAYFEKQGLRVEENSLGVLDAYIGKDYSFVASWVSAIQTPQAAQASSQKGVFVTFPTKEIYFPLIPTSVYGDAVVPATIRVLGHVSPDIFTNIQAYTKTEYYIDTDWNFSNELQNFYDKKEENLKYTKIDISAPSTFFTQDLWMHPSPPIQTYYLSFFALHPVILGVILLTISSLVTGVLTGFIVFRDLRRRFALLALMGLSNVCTLLGVLIVTVLVRTKEGTVAAEAIVTQLKQKGYLWRRRVATILLLTNIPFLVAAFFAWNDVARDLDDLFGPGHFSADGELALVLISGIVFLFSLYLKRIRPTDRDLFSQLRSHAYSSWSFHPKERMKIVFFLLFSVLFLLISWLTVEVVKYIL